MQDIVCSLHQFWAKHGCSLLHPIDIEVGAGTFHFATTLRSLDKKDWNIAYIQPCRRPSDGRYAQNPNRMQYYNQFQVLMKPFPIDIQEKCLHNLYCLGIDSREHDIKFIHSDWENPTLGAYGLGWEVLCNGMEIIQFTYMQQLGGIECQIIPAEITYGLERLSLYIQNKDTVWDLEWSAQIKYRDIYINQEIEYCDFNFLNIETTILVRHFTDFKDIANSLILKDLVYPAYAFCLKLSHIFNILDARGRFSVTERAAYIAEIRKITKRCCAKYVKKFLQ